MKIVLVCILILSSLVGCQSKHSGPLAVAPTQAVFAPELQRPLKSTRLSGALSEPKKACGQRDLVIEGTQMGRPATPLTIKGECSPTVERGEIIDPTRRPRESSIVEQYEVDDQRYILIQNDWDVERIVYHLALIRCGRVVLSEGIHVTRSFDVAGEPTFEHDWGPEDIRLSHDLTTQHLNVYLAAKILPVPQTDQSIQEEEFISNRISLSEGECAQ